MNSKSSLGVDAFKLSISKVLTLLIYMVVSMLLSRYLTIREYGTYSQLNLVINTFATLFMLGLPNSINFFLSKASSIQEENTFLSNYYTLSSILSIVLGIVLSLSAGIIANYFSNDDIYGFVYFLALYPWAHITMQSIDNVMVVYKNINRLTYFKISYAISMLGIIVIAHIFDLDFTEYMISLTAVNIVTAFIVLCLANDRRHSLRPALEKSLTKEILAFSIPVGLSTLVGTLNTELDKFLIGRLTNTEQLAIYTNAARELPISIIAGSVSAVLIPQIVRMVRDKQVDESILLWKYAIELSFILICFMVSGIFVYADEVMTILYSDKYISGVTVFRIYTLNLLLRVTYFGMYLNAYGNTKKILYSSIISLAINIALNIPFFYLFGIIGPAISTFISIMVMQLMQLFFTSRIVGTGLSYLFPWKRILLNLCVNILFGILFWYIKKRLHLELYVGEVIESLALGLIWTITYFGIVHSRIQKLWKLLK